MLHSLIHGAGWFTVFLLGIQAIGFGLEIIPAANPARAMAFNIHCALMFWGASRIAAFLITGPAIRM